jgi:hypothetical protein
MDAQHNFWQDRPVFLISATGLVRGWLNRCLIEVCSDNVCHQSQVSVLCLVKEILRAMESSLEPAVVNEASHGIRRQFLSAERVRTAQDWQPLFTLSKRSRALDSIQLAFNSIAVESPPHWADFADPPALNDHPSPLGRPKVRR